MVNNSGWPGRTPKHLGPIDPRRGRRFWRKDDGLFTLLPGSDGGPWLHARHFEPRVGPIGMIAIDAVPRVTHHQEQRAESRQLDVHRLRGLTQFHDAALPQCAAVADDAEDDAGRIDAGIVVHAYHGREALRAAAQIQGQRADGVGPQPAGEPLPTDGKRLARHRAVDLRSPPALHGLAHVERGKPDGLGRLRGNRASPTEQGARARQSSRREQGGSYGMGLPSLLLAWEGSAAGWEGK